MPGPESRSPVSQSPRPFRSSVVVPLDLPATPATIEWDLAALPSGAMSRCGEHEHEHERTSGWVARGQQ
jgi:hypothetical protein